ncbi:hypothetical protein [Flavobacterium sp. KACC 22763]|uniref:hypothetical protein n=1 Tax=Flavobacterium sp. KACC 22763 TaxID=3025668 RepID=UPI0023663903|nr:hypothetical protein [Flavobacterium sp. KACC 22763]WDF62773.1 hypothetical protein PQ463_14220 [Flavobacterium sp. KACC 22763]
MAKSISKNGLVFFLILNAFLLMPSFAQTNIVGEWKTKDIIGYADVAEFSLTKVEEINYGHRLTFKSDGTFFCDTPVKCLNDCFVFTSGTYKQVDSDHIQLIVKDVHFVGLTCRIKNLNKEDIIRDLGFFYIHKEGETIRLIANNGILKDHEKLSLVYPK